MNSADRFDGALRFLADNMPSNARSFAAVWRALPGVLRAHSEIAQAVSDHPLGRVARLVLDILRSAGRMPPHPRAGARARAACPRCKLVVAVLARAQPGHERSYRHSCPHRRLCSDGRTGAVPSCPQCAAARGAELSAIATYRRPSPGSIALVMSRRAASALPGLRLAEVRPAGDELVSVVVPAYAADHLVTGQRLVRYRSRSQPRARRAAVHLDNMGGSPS